MERRFEPHKRGGAEGGLAGARQCTGDRMFMDRSRRRENIKGQ